MSWNFVDADTIVVQAAVIEQYNYMVYKDGELICPVESKKQWVKDNPDKNVDEYEFRYEPTLKPGRLSPLKRAIATFKKKIQKIQDKYPEYKVVVCIEGPNNYRDDLYPNYKAQRDSHIILRKDLSDWIKQNWPPNRLIVSVGHETDDTCSIYKFRAYKEFLKTGKYPWLVSAVDKDLKCTAGWMYNYNEDKEYFHDELEADRWFCTQLIYGDPVDNIKALDHPLPDEMYEKYGLRKSKGKVGKTTAEKLMESCETSKECFERVIEAYKGAYGDLWLLKLQTEALALRMCHTVKETQAGSHYKIVDHFKHLGIDYGNNN